MKLLGEVLFVILSLLVCCNAQEFKDKNEIFKDLNTSLVDGHSHNAKKCENYTCCSTLQGLCNCCPFPGQEFCRQCPSDITNSNNNTCCYPDYCDIFQCGDGLDFVTAAKIAILFALSITLVAVLIAIYRGFIQPRICGRRRQRSRRSQTNSLNSIQRFVMDRLQNRPPIYEVEPEKPPSYEDAIVAGSSTIPSVSGTLPQILTDENPPSYDEALGNATDNRISLDPGRLSGTEAISPFAESMETGSSADDRGGHSNMAYEFEEIPLDLLNEEGRTLRLHD